MIKLKVDGHFLEFLPGEVSDVNITLRNPYFGFLSSYIYNLTIPYTSQVAAIFNFPSQPNRINRSKVEKPGAVIIEEMEVARGTWTAEYSGDDFLELSFEFVADEFTRTLQGKTLPNIFDEEVEPADLVAHVEETVLKTWPETDYQFPSVFNPDFYQGKNEEYSGVINLFEGTLQVSPPTKTPIVPMLYLPAIMQRIASAAGYTVRGKLLEDPFFEKLIVYNNFALDNIARIFFSGELRDATVGTESSYVILFLPTNDPTGGYNQTNGQWQVPTLSAGNYTVLLEVNHMPSDIALHNYKYEVTVYYKPTNAAAQVVVQEYVDTADPFGGSIIGHTNLNGEILLTANLGYFYATIKYFNSSSTLLSDCIVSYAQLVIENPDVNPISVFDNNFNLKNHVTKNDCIGFLSKILHDFQQIPIFDNVARVITLIPFAEALTQISKTPLSGNVLRNTFRVKQNDYKGVTIRFDYAGGDQYTSNLFAPEKVVAEYNSVAWLRWLPLGQVFYLNNINAYYRREYNEQDETYEIIPVTDYMPPYVDGMGLTEIKLMLPAAVMKGYFNSATFPTAMPGVSGAGSSYKFNLTNDCPLLLMVWVGFEESSSEAPNRFPFASTSQYDGIGVEKLPFNFNAQEIVNRYWQATIDFYRKRLPFESQRVFNAKELKTLRFDHLHEIHNSLALLEELYVTASANEIEGEVKGYIV